MCYNMQQGLHTCRYWENSGGKNMSDRRTRAKILALIMSLVFMLAGCGAGNGAAEESGNAIQGEPLGMMTKGEAITDLMNDMK